MKIEIIPTILVQTFDEVKEKIKAVEEYVEWVQLDIMDGIFVNNETWHNPKDLKGFKTKAKIEVHLMVQYPEKIFNDWLKVADRIIIHFESKITNRELGIRELIEKCHKNKIEFGLALNPETHWAVATPFFKDLDLILLMSVQPGWGGQELKEWVLEKAEALREKGYKGNIEIDGGVNDENIKKVIKSGVNLICVGTYIFRNKDIKKAIEELKNYV
jgi:ribulose-phosphate 3-epimerase